MERQIKILMLEDNIFDAKLVKLELKKSGLQYLLNRVETKEDFYTQTRKFKPDIVLADYNLPTYNGLLALKYTKRYHPNLPIIILTGSIEEEAIIETIEMGALNYILKEDLLRLVPADCIMKNFVFGYSKNLFNKPENKSESGSIISKLLSAKKNSQIV